MTKPGDIRAAIHEAQELDAQWIRHPAGRDDRRSTPWMPFPLFDYIALLAEAMPVTEGDRFLEIGCGVGSKMLVARELFGLDVHGFDRVPAYIQQARNLGLDAVEADALGYDGYGKYDIVWFNRPFRDAKLEFQLEQEVWDSVAPGAVVIGANLEALPPPTWMTVLDDFEVRRGIWWKPPPAA